MGNVVFLELLLNLLSRECNSNNNVHFDERLKLQQHMSGALHYGLLRLLLVERSVSLPPLFWISPCMVVKYQL